MPLRRRSVLILLFIALSIAAFQPVCAQSASPSNLPPEHPITRTQLEALFTELGYSEAEKAFIHSTLETNFAKMPAWFPRSVWQEVEERVEALNPVEIALPIYQKYVSTEEAESIVLILDGPTGHEIAKKMTGRAVAALQTGARGSAADEMAINAANAGGDSQLFAKRIQELAPEQQTNLLPAFQRLQSVWRQIDDEQDKAFNQQANTILQSVLKEHNADLLAAKQAYTRKSPANPSTKQ